MKTSFFRKTLSKNEEIKPRKRLPIFIWTIFGLILTVALATAITTITENKITTANTNYDSLTYQFGNYSSSRDIFSKKYVNVTVCSNGCNYTTIQSAIWDVPIFLNHQYKIQIRNGYYPENVYINTIIANGDTAINDSSHFNLKILGNSSNINGVIVNSFHIISAQGSLNPYIAFMHINGSDPQSNENASIGIFGSQDVTIVGVNLSGLSSIGIVAYASGVSVTQIDLGSSKILGKSKTNGFVSKHTGYFHFESSFLTSGNVSNTYNVIGNVSEYVYLNNGGVAWGFVKNGATTVNSREVARGARAPVFGYSSGTGESGIMYGVDETEGDFNVTGNLNVEGKFSFGDAVGNQGCQSDITATGTYTLYCRHGGGNRDVYQAVKAASGTGDYYEAIQGSTSVYKVADKGNVVLGNGTYQAGLTLTSPNGTEFCLRVWNNGSIISTSGACS